MLSLRVILAITFLNFVHSATCPISIKSCNDANDCTGKYKCFNDIDGYKNKRICCDQNGTFCTATGFTTYYEKKKYYIHKYHAKYHASDTYYKDPKTGTACLFPYLKNPVTDENMLPEGFSKNGIKKLDECTNHTACGEGFFCGTTNNIIKIEKEKRRYCYKRPIFYNIPLLEFPTEDVFRMCSSSNECESGICVNVAINKSKSSSYCIEAQKCFHGITTFPRKECNSTLECNTLDGTPIEGKWTNWCDLNGYCCHDPANLATGMCPDRATLAFNEIKCEKSNSAPYMICPNRPDAQCSFNHCCPGLEVYDNRASLSKSVYETNMPCNEANEVPNPFRYAYCNGSHLVVIGSMDKSGGTYMTNRRDIRCRINRDCSAHGLSVCVRVSATELYCNRDPINTVNEEEELWYIIGITVTILVILTFIGILIFACKKKIRNCWKRIFPEKPIDERCKLAQVIKEAIEEKRVRRRFRAHLISSCQYRRYEVGMPKRLPQDKLEELIHMGYEDFADKYDYSYTQSRKEWEKWTGDLMDNILTQELVAEKEKTAGTIFIPREVEITKKDLERGKQEQPEVSLKDVYFNEKDYCVYRIGSDIDDVELDPSTESMSSSDDDSDPKPKKGENSEKKKECKSQTTSTKSKGNSKSKKVTKTKTEGTASSKSNNSKQRKAGAVKEVKKDVKLGNVPKETGQKTASLKTAKSKREKK